MSSPTTPRTVRATTSGLRIGLLTTVLASALTMGPLTTAGPAAAEVTAAPKTAADSASATTGPDGGSTGSGDNGRGPVPVYEAVGADVSGGGDLASAVDVEPGIYRDVLDQGGTDASVREGSMHFYRLPDLTEGESVHAAAVLALDGQVEADGNDSAGLKMEFLSPTGDSCGTTQSATAAQGSNGLPLVVAGHSDVMDEAATYGCFEDGSGRVSIKVTREGLWQSDTPVPVELRFWIEPPVDESQLAEASDEDLAPESVTASGAATPVEAGSSFATATELDPDRVYSLEIRPTQVQFFKIPVEYGQRMNYRLSTGNNRDASVLRIDSAVFNPLLAEPRMVGGSTSLSHLDVGSVATGNTAVHVRADEHGSYTYETLRFAGDYYIALSASKARSNREGSQPFRYELAVSLTGDPGGTTEWLAEAQSQQAAESGADGVQAQAAGSSRPGWLPTGTELGALLGGVGLGAVLAGLAWLLLRRRNRSA